MAVSSVGICGSDLHWFLEGSIGELSITEPVVPGHEFAGVALDGPYAGRRVAVDPAIPCGQCEQCRAGHGNLCPTVRFAGHAGLDGALQQELVWPDRLLFPLPDSLSDDAGAMLEPLGVAIHAIGLSHVHPGDDVLVVGAGPIGALAVQVARRPARTECSPASRWPTAARPPGARARTAPGPPDQTPDAVHEATQGRGVDVGVEVAGSDDGLTTAVACATPGARLALAGIPSTPRSSFPAAESRRKGLTFVLVRRMHETYPRAIELAEHGIDLDVLVTARWPLEDAAEAFAHAASRTGDKTVVSLLSDRG